MGDSKNLKIFKLLVHETRHGHGTVTRRRAPVRAAVDIMIDRDFPSLTRSPMCRRRVGHAAAPLAVGLVAALPVTRRRGHWHLRLRDSESESESSVLWSPNTSSRICQLPVKVTIMMLVRRHCRGHVPPPLQSTRTALLARG
jgi:hypothetical protein